MNSEGLGLSLVLSCACFGIRLPEVLLSMSMPGRFTKSVGIRFAPVHGRAQRHAHEEIKEVERERQTFACFRYLPNSKEPQKPQKMVTIKHRNNSSEDGSTLALEEIDLSWKTCKLKRSFLCFVVKSNCGVKFHGEHKEALVVV